MIIKNLDIFCEVIDNYGDIGVVYRLAKEIKSKSKSIEIRVFLNRLDEFIEINKKIRKVDIQEVDGITYITNEYLVKNICTFSPANVIIEAFGCSIFEGYLKKAFDESSILINLEYLSGEDWIEEVHLMESPLGAKKLKKYFFMPGFTSKTGGIITDSLFLERKKKVLENKEFYLKKYLNDIEYKEMFIGTIFSYEKNFLPLIEALKVNEKNNCLLLMGDKTQSSFKTIFKDLKVEKINNKIYKIGENITLKFMPFLNQEDYEELINIVDYNFVRGEDSFVRSLLVGKPFNWHIYLQDEMAHMDKINGFIDRYKEAINNNVFNKALDIHTKLLKDYNYRKDNSLKIGVESYYEFFKNFDEICTLSKKYSEYLEKNCNLIDKLNEFILKY